MNLDNITFDREAISDMQILLSSLHGRVCTRITKCGCMEESTQLSGQLVPLAMAYNDAERVAAVLHDRCLNILNIVPAKKA